MDITIHANPQLPHQVRYAGYFQKGFLSHGIPAKIAYNCTDKADIHVVIGPYFAKDSWLGHPRVILADRCYYKGDPEHVSVGWMDKKGGRNFCKGEGRKAPEKKPQKISAKTIFLADYNGPIEPADKVRRHPVQEAHSETLEKALESFGVAIGYQTTALVTAGLEGLKVVCKDDRNIMSRPDWLELLPYADWHWQEIENGELWEHLQLSLPQL